MQYQQPFAYPQMRMQMPMMAAYPYPYMMPQPYSYPQYNYIMPNMGNMGNMAQGYMPNAYGYNYQQPTHPIEPPAKRARHHQHQPEAPFHSTQNDPKAWRNCSQKGCKYLGPGDEVALHEQDRHLIYPEGYVPERSEEEEAYLKKGG